jgi:hypothetical protein
MGWYPDWRYHSSLMANGDRGRLMLSLAFIIEDLGDNIIGNKR